MARGTRPASTTSVSKSRKAGLTFPVARVVRHLKDSKVANRVSPGAGVFAAAVLEYLTAELVELAGNQAKEEKKKRILPRHIMLALKSDEEFNGYVLRNRVVIAGGGAEPHIMHSLLPKAKAPSTPVTKKSKPKPKASTPSTPLSTPPKTPTKKKAKATKHAGPASAGPSGALLPSPLRAPVSFEQLGSKRLFLGQNLKIVKSNLATHGRVDAVVHPTNNSFSTAGLVGGELARVGGAGFHQEVQAARSATNLAVTKCFVTNAGNLPVSKVIHCHSPSWKGSNSLKELKGTIENVLKLADDENLKSIALPSIGSGKNGFPKDDAARAILQAIDEYFQSIMASSLKEVHFVLFDDESLDVYNKIYAHEFA